MGISESLEILVCVVYAIELVEVARSDRSEKISTDISEFSFCL